jgi:ribonuclease J
MLHKRDPLCSISALRIVRPRTCSTDKSSSANTSCSTTMSASASCRPSKGLYDAEQLRGLAHVRPYSAKTDRKTAVFISHLHLDHMLGIGCIQETIPVYMTKTSRRLYHRLYQIGEGVQGINRNYQKMRLHEPVRIGEIEVTAFPMDHDVVGACGFYIKTPDGTIFYTGDLRFHGLHPERTVESIAKARELGTDVLTLRNIERLLAIVDGARRAGRNAVFEPESAYILLTMTDCREFLVYESDNSTLQFETGSAPSWLRKVITRIKFISAGAINERPGSYLIQNSYANLLELYELDLTGGVYIHSDGVPLGAFDPTYGKLLTFLESIGLPFVPLRCGGHAPAQHLKHVVDMIDPSTLVPLHSFNPELLKPKSGVQLLPEYGRTYRLEAGQLL